ncbi:hypothetical protein N7533_003996 [Penicillium manginii]|uniref:uncharacterized protein n=1 Tax=Penicillium manginii TaxID=203109 RepID=UPI002546D814|nr:uncharacterized protein N7533_003996 [Penicillium manginii]KAJ5754453.1 hypothetical protein N7533_003996 [Penicillium manginii]
MGKHQKSKSCRQGQKRTYRQTLVTNSIQKAFLGASSNCKKFTTLQLEERLCDVAYYTSLTKIGTIVKCFLGLSLYTELTVGVTTDNATNNETLIRALQESLLSSGAISTRESIVRVPCMAYVIQLCLKQLLGHIRAAPKNKEVRRFWSDT